MIQMPPTFSLGGKSILNERTVYNVDPREKQTFQVQVQVDAQTAPTCDMLSSTNLQITTENDQTNSIQSSEPQSVGSTEITLSDLQRDNPDVEVNPVHGSLQSAEVIEPPIGRGPFVCSICFKSFQGYQQFRKHKTSHLDEKPFRCVDCGAQFNFEMNLKLHTMVHDAFHSGNLQCQVCLAKFSRLGTN